MNNLRVGLFALGVMVVAVARAGEVTVVSNVLGPEGPLYVDGSLYYVRGIPAHCLAGTEKPARF